MVVLLRPEFRRRLLGPLPSADSGPPTFPRLPVAQQGNRMMAPYPSDLRKHRVGATVPPAAQKACVPAQHGARRPPPYWDVAPGGHDCGSEATSLLWVAASRPPRGTVYSARELRGRRVLILDTPRGRCPMFGGKPLDAPVQRALALLTL